MRLYKDRELLNQAVAATARCFKTDPSIVEKDYYLTVFLRQLLRRMPGLVLTGSRALFQCHRVIHRFSEGLDLALTQDPVPKEVRKQVKKAITGVCADLGFKLLNGDEIRAGRDFNRYEIDYSPKNPAAAARSVFLVTVDAAEKVYSCEKKQAASMICAYLLAAGREDLIRQYKLQPFPISVQPLDRLLIDKIFALCDSYLASRIPGNARHIYDIGRIADHVVPDADFAALFQKIREDRRPDDARSASVYNQSGIPAILAEILEQEVYKDDYLGLTEHTLIDGFSYEEAAAGLQKLIDCGLPDSRIIISGISQNPIRS